MPFLEKFRRKNVHFFMMLDLRKMDDSLVTPSTLHIPAIAVMQELLEMQNVQPHHTPLIQNLHFNTLKF